jgi:hypothetical protein
MTINELNNLIEEYLQCKNYLEGRIHSPKIAQLAAEAAQTEIELHRDSIIHDLIQAGLHIEGD